MVSKTSVANTETQNTSTTRYGKYRNLLVLIASFLGLVALLSLVSFFAANQFAKATQEIEVATQQGVIIEQLSKNLLDVNLYLDELSQHPSLTATNPPAVNNAVAVGAVAGVVEDSGKTGIQLQDLSQSTLYRIEEIKNQQAIFSQALKSLQEGGSVAMLNGQTVDISALQDEKLRATLGNVEQIWIPYVGLLDNFQKDIAKGVISKQTSDYLVDYTRLYNQILQSEMSDVSTGLTASAQHQADILKFIQIAGILAAIGLFVAIIFGALRQLVNNDRLLAAAQQETAEIMQTVNTGLFLLDRNLTIGNQYSNALENIIGAENLAGEKLSSVLRNRISDKDLQTTEEFIEQLYNPKVKEKLVESLNPLQQVMFQNIGDNKTRYLDFKFSRVYEKKDITRILVNVNDVSDAVLLEQRLERERAQNDMQIEMLTTILNVSPTIINEFISNTYVHIQKMNDVLKNPGSSQFELEGKLKLLYREMHSLKGEASALKLHSFTKIASEAEHKLHELQNQGKLSGNDFLALTVFLDELLNLSNLIAGIGERINSTLLKPQAPTLEHLPEDDVLFYDASSETKPVQRSEFAEYLESFGADIAGRQNKQITVDASQIDSVVIPKRLATTVREICVQLLRNAIVHGIADSQQRIANGKSPVGHVSINAHVQGNDCFVFSVEDDGRGIDYEIIREKLITSGRVTEEQAQELTQAQLLNVIFNSGFSTKSVVDEDSGRGVGLDIVKDRVKVAGGKISVESEKGKFCRFTIKLPLNAE